MDRKKTIVAAVMINAGILTVLFIAAMTMREEPVKELESGRAISAPSDPKPLFKEKVEVPSPVPLTIERSQPVAFALPPAALVEPTHTLNSVDTPAAPLAVASQPAPIQTSVQSPAVSSTSFPSGIEIEVQKGDSLEKLAKKHHTSVDEIIKLNQLPSSFLRVGQRLKMPSGKMHETPKPKTPAPATSENAEYYTMKVGDNPWSIAMKHHIKVDELLKLNGLNEKTARKLKPGDRLRIK